MKQKTTPEIVPTNLPVELVWLRHLTRISDDLFQIPGTNIRFGLDPILGLIPWAGDITGGIISGMLMLAMARYGASGEVVLKMTGNILLDYLLGSIPLLGDLFDFGFQANLRNLHLLEEHWGEGKHSGTGRTIAILALILILATGYLLGWLIWTFLHWIWTMLF